MRTRASSRRASDYTPASNRQPHRAGTGESNAATGSPGSGLWSRNLHGHAAAGVSKTRVPATPRGTRRVAVAVRERRQAARLERIDWVRRPTRPVLAERRGEGRHGAEQLDQSRKLHLDGQSRSRSPVLTSAVHATSSDVGSDGTRVAGGRRSSRRASDAGDHLESRAGPDAGRDTIGPEETRPRPYARQKLRRTGAPCSPGGTATQHLRWRDIPELRGEPQVVEGDGDARHTPSFELGTADRRAQPGRRVSRERKLARPGAARASFSAREAQRATDDARHGLTSKNSSNSACWTPANPKPSRSHDSPHW